MNSLQKLQKQINEMNNVIKETKESFETTLNFLDGVMHGDSFHSAIIDEYTRMLEIVKNTSSTSSCPPSSLTSSLTSSSSSSSPIPSPVPTMPPPAKPTNTNSSSNNSNSDNKRQEKSKPKKPVPPSGEGKQTKKTAPKKLKEKKSESKDDEEKPKKKKKSAAKKLKQKDGDSKDEEKKKIKKDLPPTQRKVYLQFDQLDNEALLSSKNNKDIQATMKDMEGALSYFCMKSYRNTRSIEFLNDEAETIADVLWGVERFKKPYPLTMKKVGGIYISWLANVLGHEVVIDGRNYCLKRPVDLENRLDSYEALLGPKLKDRPTAIYTLVRLAIQLACFSVMQVGETDTPAFKLYGLKKGVDGPYADYIGSKYMAKRLKSRPFDKKNKQLGYQRFPIKPVEIKDYLEDFVFNIKEDSKDEDETDDDDDDNAVVVEDRSKSKSKSKSNNDLDTQSLANEIINAFEDENPVERDMKIVVAEKKMEEKKTNGIAPCVCGNGKFCKDSIDGICPVFCPCSYCRGRVRLMSNDANAFRNSTNKRKSNEDLDNKSEKKIKDGKDVPPPPRVPTPPPPPTMPTPPPTMPTTVPLPPPPPLTVPKQNGTGDEDDENVDIGGTPENDDDIKHNSTPCIVKGKQNPNCATEGMQHLCPCSKIAKECINCDCRETVILNVPSTPRN